MKYSSRLFLGAILINVCIVFFSVVGMVIAALLIKMFSAMLSLVFYDHFDVSLNEIFFVMKLGCLGGCMMGGGWVFLRLLKVKGF